MAKLVVMLRIKDGILFVDEWLARMETLADEIVVLDNGSTDGTYEILKAHPKVVDIIRTEGFNEGRDKNLMYDHARKRDPDWCLWIDVDEIFEPQLTRQHFDRLMSSRVINKYAFRRFHFIDREHFAGSWFRLNYSSGHDRLLWREDPSGYFQDLIIDSPNVKGISGLRRGTDYRLKHLGYINKEIVDKKAELYRSITPEKEDILQTMYLENEKKIEWIDDRRSIKVIMLNTLLNLIQVTHLISKVKRRLFGYLNLNKA
ncbi:glycosyltransferase family 2 protein [Mucilaginibacter sp. RB4R14]|uniref:glycosyltransferase family 2 protein n=1 Tax=Mucilaginibacter aurantiaciroseus TaxID=2949308 RepID=UPI0020900178|nr:glycosyltransferase family 2 protein [Mucilaginibacter aurantiaciroseus]MCO5934659.1 glycosyltransferase family 2 protein [Mucilaginibacter aurantiaciroseus]